MMTRTNRSTCLVSAPALDALSRASRRTPFAPDPWRTPSLRPPLNSCRKCHLGYPGRSFHLGASLPTTPADCVPLVLDPLSCPTRSHLAGLNFEVKSCSALMVPQARHHRTHMTPGCMSPGARFADSALQSMMLVKASALPFRFVLSWSSRLVLLLTSVLPISVGDTADMAALEIPVTWVSAVPAVHSSSRRYDGLSLCGRLRACCRSLSWPSTPRLHRMLQEGRRQVC